ncbi:MAG: type II 3-dehydroquinate dehydratase [Bacillota bacterium]|nr:type II 3-dehydroquinate dehydratase [Bacillota bacterium]HOA90787.1 type II 3-dehydroquinate dehydratase [Bacillota bacterium]HOJ46771.1 type II 3-dehydroquinate dehydratase [Bacillota bacterium]HPT60178.1 type II 3-dehydroquinate dehydratase [Bacillota bacterium]HPZ72877.1 type II 3-dehydroquinate dehydratase [Bacillota bacterium]
MKGATIWVINGPNLNLLGEREPEIYGRETLTDVEKKIGEIAEENQVNLEFFQENEEGKLVTLIQKARLHADGLLLNPGAYSHYSLAIYDALRAITIPKVEVHISQVAAREEFRRNLLTAGACDGLIAGLGTYGYVLGLYALLELIKEG